MLGRTLLALPVIIVVLAVLIFLSCPGKAHAYPGLANQSVDGIASSGAAFHVLANPQGLPTNVYFQYGVDPGAFAAGTNSVQVDNGISWVAVDIGVGGLDCGTTYWYRAVAYDSTYATTALTFEPFATSGCGTQVFADGFESGNLSAWSGFASG